jgi:hypothetical protein
MVVEAIVIAIGISSRSRRPAIRITSLPVEYKRMNGRPDARTQTGKIKRAAIRMLQANPIIDIDQHGGTFCPDLSQAVCGGRIVLPIDSYLRGSNPEGVEGSNEKSMHSGATAAGF